MRITIDLGPRGARVPDLLTSLTQAYDRRVWLTGFLGSAISFVVWQGEGARAGLEGFASVVGIPWCVEVAMHWRGRRTRRRTLGFEDSRGRMIAPSPQLRRAEEHRLIDSHTPIGTVLRLLSRRRVAGVGLGSPRGQLASPSSKGAV